MSNKSESRPENGGKANKSISSGKHLFRSIRVLYIILIILLVISFISVMIYSANNTGVEMLYSLRR